MLKENKLTKKEIVEEYLEKTNELNKGIKDIALSVYSEGLAKEVEIEEMLNNAYVNAVKKKNIFYSGIVKRLGLKELYQMYLGAEEAHYNALSCFEDVYLTMHQIFRMLMILSSLLDLATNGNEVNGIKVDYYVLENYIREASHQAGEMENTASDIRLVYSIHGKKLTKAKLVA